MTRDTLLDAAPGPSPWYLRNLGPKPPGYSWVAAEEKGENSGITLLQSHSGTLMLVNMYNYVAALDSSSLLIWQQLYVQQGGPSAPVVLRGFAYDQLSPLSAATHELCALMRARKLPVITQGAPLFESALPTVTIDEKIDVQFPNELKQKQELLVLCSSSAIQPGPRSGHGNQALMVANPAEGHIRLYPQGWFNDGRVDLGYQWVTRVARDPRTNRIRGDGIRIGAFILDDTLRNLER
jgi:hypothetical protein